MKILLVVLAILFVFMPFSGVSTKAENEVNINLAPFVCQAPFSYMKPGTLPPIVEGDKSVPDLGWGDDRQANACEEATLTMAALYLSGVRGAPEAGVKDKEMLLAARDTIFKLCQFQVDNFADHVEWLDKAAETTVWKGYYQDSSVARTAKIWTASGILQGAKAEIIDNPLYAEIKREIDGGSVIAAPINGTLGLKSQYYYLDKTVDRHMVLIIGYSEMPGKTMEAKRYIIVNDPGTKNGERYYFPAEDFLKCIQDYPSGSKAPRELPEHFKRRVIVLCKD